MDRPPIVVSPYDAELYGHWWYEGPMFLGDLFRQLHYDQHVGRDDHARRLSRSAPDQPGGDAVGVVLGARRATTSTGSTRRNAWVYRHLHARRRAHGRAGAPASRGARRSTARALNQAARELMLAQSSDWAFIMQTGTTVSYATRRFERARPPLHSALRGAPSGTVDERLARASVEAKDNIFPDLDYRLYAT